MTKLGLAALSLSRRPGRAALAVGCFALTSFMCVATFTLVAHSDTSQFGGFPGPRVIVTPYGDWPIPLAHVEAIKNIPGVTDVEYQRLLLTDDRRYFVWAISDGWVATHPPGMVGMSKEAEDAWRRDRRAIIADATVAGPLHWKIGNPVTFTADGREVTGVLVGYQQSRLPQPLIFAHYDHINQDAKHPGILSRLSVGCAASNCSEVARLIDERFADGDASTFSLRQEEFFGATTQGAAGSSLAQSISRLFLFVGFAIILVTGIVTGSSLAIGFRERMSEIAALRAIGFSRATLFGILLSESLLAALLGGLLGALPVFLWSHWRPISIGNVLEGLTVPTSLMLAGMGVATVLGVLVCLGPATQSLRRSIIEGLND